MTTLRHEPLQIDAGMARMLVLLDGSRNADAIGSALEGTELARLPVPALLDQVARAAVLMAVRE